jgi:predicted dehydrogenase
MTAVGIGIIGYGYWGPNLVRNFAETDGARVAAISDLSPERLELAARRSPGAFISTDFQNLLKAPDVDAIVIATPVNTHYELALAALQAGKHVLIEKPMTQSAGHAQRLIDEAARRRLVLMVDHTFVYTGAVRKIRELVLGGELGEIYYYDAVRMNLGLFQKDVNVVWDLAVHDLSILNYVLDAQPVAVSASGVCHVEGSPENMAYITLYYPGSTIAHVNVNWLAPVKVRRTLIGGSRKMIIYDDLEPSEKIKIYDKGVTLRNDPEQIRQLLVGYRAGDMWAPQLPVKEALRSEAEHFIACVRDGLAPLTDGLAGLRVVELLEAASRSLRLRGHPVEIGQLRRAS